MSALHIPSLAHKIVTWEQAAAQLAEWQASDERTVFTNGCFDLLHAGHIAYLNEARLLGQHLIIGVNTDTSIQKLKGDSRPIKQLAERLYMLAALECVCLVTPFAEETPLELITRIQPDILVKGGDYSIETIIGAQEVLSRGGEVKVLPFLEGFSTTAMIRKIQAE